MDGVTAILLVVSSLGIGVAIARVALSEVLRMARIGSSDRRHQ